MTTYDTKSFLIGALAGAVVASAGWFYAMPERTVDPKKASATAGPHAGQDGATDLPGQVTSSVCDLVADTAYCSMRASEKDGSDFGKALDPTFSTSKPGNLCVKNSEALCSLLTAGYDSEHDFAAINQYCNASAKKDLGMTNLRKGNYFCNE